MPLFKGLEKKDNGELLAVIGFDQAKVHRAVRTGNQVGFVTEPLPYYEERFNSAELERMRVKMDDLKALPYAEDGHRIELYRQTATASGPTTAPVTPRRGI